MLDKIQKRIIRIYLYILAAGGIYWAIIHMFGRGLPCYFRELTGLTCPGCGSSRMMLAALRMDFVQAICYNPVAFFAFSGWIIISIMIFINKPRAIRSSKVLWTLFTITIVAYMIQCVIRNII